MLLSATLRAGKRTWSQTGHLCRPDSIKSIVACTYSCTLISPLALAIV